MTYIVKPSFSLWLSTQRFSLHTEKYYTNLSSLHQQIHRLPHIITQQMLSMLVQRECNSLTKMSGLFATDSDLTAKRPVVWVRLVFTVGCLVWPLRVLSTNERLQRVFPALCSLSTAQMLPSARIRGMLCVCVRLSQSVNSSGFSRRSPHWSFLAIQNNFLGWLYATRCQSKLQLCAQMVSTQPQKRRGEQMCTMLTQWRRQSRPAKLTAAWLPRATLQPDW